MLHPVAAIALALAVMAVSAWVGVSMSRRSPAVTEMLGMMVGMTQGMMTGIAVGYLAGAATDMFVGNLVGLAVGLAFGITFGRSGGLMGAMDGGMGGMMGGMMGAMLGVMVQYLHGGWAVVVTAVVVLGLYLVAMAALVRLGARAGAAETDPVCGMAVDPATATYALHGGRLRYFCSAACQREFVRVARAGAGAGEPDAAAASSAAEPARRTVAADEDPVCAMAVDAGAARAKGLAAVHGGREYLFCGKGCLLEFRDDPEAVLAPGYARSM